MKHKRIIRGRQWVLLDEVPYLVEMRADGVHIRRKWARTTRRIAMQDLVSQSLGQAMFRFEDTE